MAIPFSYDTPLPLLVGAEEGYRIAPPTIGEQTALALAEIAPAIAGGVFGGWLGAGVGAAGGNIWSQYLRNEWGLQEGINPGELAAGTAAAMVPVGKLLQYGTAARIATRTGQGILLSEAELAGRTILDEGRLPSEQEAKMAAMFGGIIGGGMGAIEAKFFNQTLDIDSQVGDTLDDTIKKTGDKIKEAGGTKPYLASHPELEGLLGGKEPTPTNIVEGLSEMVGDAVAKVPAGEAAQAASRRTQSSSWDDFAEELNSPQLKSWLDYTDVEYGKVDYVLREELYEATKAWEAWKARAGKGEERAAGIAGQRAKEGARLKKNLERAKNKISQAQKKSPKAVPSEAVPRAEEMKAKARELMGDDPNQVYSHVVSDVTKAIRENIGPAQADIFEKEAKRIANERVKARQRQAVQESPVETAPAAPKQADDALALERSNQGYDDFPGGQEPPVSPKQEEGLEFSPSDMLEAYEARRTKQKEGLEFRPSDILEAYEAPKQKAVGAPELPRELRGAKPRYNYRQTSIELEFENDIAKALYIVGGRGKSKEHNAYLNWLEEAGVQDIPAKGQAIRDSIKAQAKKGKDVAQVSVPDVGGDSRFLSALVGGALPAGSLAAYLSDEDGDMSKASLLSLLGLGIVLAALGGGVQALRRRPGFPSYGKTKASQKVKPKDTPRAVQADQIKGSAADDGAYKPPSSLRKTWDSVSNFTSEHLSLLSRRAKKIHPQIAAALRKPFLDINKDVKEYKKRALPFFLELQKKIKSPKGQELLMRSFLNSNTDEMKGLRELAKTYKVSLEKLVETRNVFQELHTRLREEAGVDLGKIENFMPRTIGDYRSFQRFLDESPLLRDQKNEVDKALADYAQKQKYDGVEAIPEAEAAVVTTRVLEGNYPGLAQSPGNVMSRKIVEVNDQMLAAYLKPVESIERYIDTMVRHLHYRKALGRGLLKTQTKEIKGEGFRDVFQNDLGIAAQVDDTIAQKVSLALAEEHGFAGQQAKIDELRKIIQATFDPTQVPSLIQGFKTATYLQTLTNLGSTITQFGEVAYAFHFYGLSNTFRSAFRSKFNRDFFEELGLSKDADIATTTGGLQGLLDWLFKRTGFTKMDKWAKNTTMNAAWKKLHQRSRKDSVNLKAELTLKFGDEKATRMLRDLQEIKPSMTAKLTDDLEEVIFNEISDLSPITRMEQAAAHRGLASIFYTLKSFTLKQADIYREVSGERINKAKELYAQGKHKEAAIEAAKGVGGLTALAAWFAAANASTDVVKDTIYGRPVKLDEVVENNLLKLLFVNRYLKHKYEREGLGKAGLELFVPATPVFDRAGKDMLDMATFDDIKGHTLQGTPLDLLYWRWLGGLDKIEKQYGK